ncbi:hypothetical protein [Phycicoccus avicenniae]|uniref:hypothetical protein n=1 Tax=Phycicoccus avicenniae TaxID=2828860 RepID=UPI003D29CAC0
MNAASLSVQKARALASSLRTTRSSGRGWNGTVDRDLVREANELYVLSQTSHHLPRHI